MGTLNFCNTCGKILDLFIEWDKIYGKCTCGFMTEIETNAHYSEKIIQKPEKGSGVYTEPETIGFPHKCQKCGHDSCDIYDIKAGYSDESDIILLRCKKCKYVERQADGSSNN